VVDYVICRACETIQVFPLPKDVSDYYNFYPVHHKKSYLHRFVGKIMNGMIYYRPKKNAKQLLLLDYGCGNGDYLQSLNEKCRQIFGFETNINQTLKLEGEIGCKVFSNTIELKNSLKNKVDVITMHMVLEHLVNVREMFTLAKQLLKQGGIFYIVIPDAQSWEARLFGSKWHGLDAPRHINFLSQKALEHLASINGMKLIRKRPVSFANSIAGSLSNLLTGKFSNFWLIVFSPVSVLLSRLFPSGSKAYYFESLSNK